MAGHVCFPFYDRSSIPLHDAATTPLFPRCTFVELLLSTKEASAPKSRPQMRPLLRKLNAGQPIVVAVFGSSVSAVYGGCFQREDYKDYLRRLGAKYEYNHVAQLIPSHKGDCTRHPVSWLKTFMKQINTTWPHPGHVLVNLGGSGIYSLVGRPRGVWAVWGPGLGWGRGRSKAPQPL